MPDSSALGSRGHFRAYLAKLQTVCKREVGHSW
jgi:hypothetical protein